MTDSESLATAVARQSARARWAIGFLIAAGVINLIAVFSTLGQVALLQDALGGSAITDSAAAANDARQQLIGTLQVLALIATAVVFLLWLYAAYGNVRLVGSQKTRTSPGWVVGCWFIPFINLVRPYQAVTETWQRSQSGNANPSTDGLPRPALVGFWWGAFLVSGLLGRLFANLIEAAKTVEEFHSASLVGIAADSVSLAAAVLAIMVVKGIDQRQRQLMQGAA